MVEQRLAPITTRARGGMVTVRESSGGERRHWRWVWRRARCVRGLTQRRCRLASSGEGLRRCCEIGEAALSDVTRCVRKAARARGLQQVSGRAAGGGRIRRRGRGGRARRKEAPAAEEVGGREAAEGSELSVTGTTVARNRATAVLPLPSVIPRPPAPSLSGPGSGLLLLSRLSRQHLSPRFSFSRFVRGPSARPFESLMVRVTGRRLREVRLCALFATVSSTVLRAQQRFFA